MKIFITGASGFLGSHTAEELARRGHSLTALVRKTSKIDHLGGLNIQFVEGSLPDCGPLAPVLKSCDAIIHIAGNVKALKPEDLFKVNAEGTSHLVNETLNTLPSPRLFLHVSTIAVHNPSEGDDFCLPPERCHPLSHYGKSKLAGETKLKKLRGKIRTLILRPPVLYGPRDQEFLQMFRAIGRGVAPLYRTGENQLSVCFVRDVARAIADLVEKNPEKDEVFCLDDGEVHTWRNLAEGISETMGRKVRYLPIPAPIFYLAAGISQGWSHLSAKPTIFTLDKMQEIKKPRWICGNQKIRKYLGWEPKVSLREGFEKTLNYYREVGLL